ncbi:hypothetical protein CBM2626_B30100 [Cupriavidus taiwanensis]|uniref:hypothetical protein n=1 Tax=Cupriavidus taiwanensis TaxID=164546 RepID=UPI000E137BAA|nr:hypothetical protein [Cupriavidus taiwanensis]SPA02782.1 hypothetical protein CBM2626_B30100 [Cupriavidus taiwanensis]
MGMEFSGISTFGGLMELWATVLTSSAVGSLVSLAGTVYTKWRDRQREDNKEKKRIAHVYLDVAMQLETFARGCGARLMDIDRGLAERAQDHDESFLNRLAPFTMAFDPVPNWTELPVDFVAKMRAFPSEFASTSAWISEQWRIWAEIDEAYALEEQSLAHYGLRAFRIAKEIRTEVGAGALDSNALCTLFQAEIDRRRDIWLSDRNAITLIPELDADFNQGTY